MSQRRNFVAVLTAAVVLAGFAVGVWRLFAVRFAAGDVHPPYSTLNAGPTGARAVYDSLERLGRPEVARHVLPLARFEERAGTTLVLAGAGAAVFGDDTVENFERFESLMRDGLQVVVALNPRAVPEDALSMDPVANPWQSDFEWPPRGKGGTGGRAKKGEENEVAMVSAGERWGFQFEPAINPQRAPKDGFEVVPAEAGPPAAPRWFSVWRWAGINADWKRLALVDGRPVIIRRDFGRGSLTLLSDTVFLSNEALWRAPEPGFLLWLLAREPRLVFDESLHGTISSPGVMYLMRRYRLLGFLAGAAVLLALFAWRASTSLVPVHESVLEAPDRHLIGAEGTSGFSNLLRQTIPPRDVLRTSFTEWAKSPFVRRRVTAAAVVKVRDLVAAAEADSHATPAATSRAIALLLASARRGVKPADPAGEPAPPVARGQ